MLRCYQQGTRLELSKFCTGVWDKRTWAREAEESLMLEDVAKERLVKIQQAGKDLAWSDLQSMEISDSVRVICIYGL
jgi:hypothetical protein